jgi:TRAP-type uncharacterized transport system substrate-binding protein
MKKTLSLLAACAAFALGQPAQAAAPIFDALAIGGIVMLYDPLAPNWEIEAERLNADTYRFALRMKRYHTGGAGESLQILKRRAAQLQYAQGYAEYQILEYTEGIDSRTLGAQRVADAVVRLVRRNEADSFALNEGSN